MKTITCIIAAAIGLAVPAFATATPAYVAAEAELMAGPDQDYPQLDVLPAGISVDIQGCTDGWQWCDVIAGDERGWVPGDSLEMQYDQQWAPVPEYAPSYGIPIVAFSIQSYWPAYYSYYPFYARRWSWYRWQPPYRSWPHRPTQHLPPPRVMPLPHPIPNPPPRVVPLPRPIFGTPPMHRQPPWNGPGSNPPPRVLPMPHPTPSSPPRVVPMPHPVPNSTPARQPAPRQAKDHEERR